MRSHGQITRQKIIESGLYLFWLQGYAATGIAEILKRSEVNAGSFYYFFKTKEALLLAVLELYIEMLKPRVVNPVFSNLAKFESNARHKRRLHDQLLVFGKH